jgi:hypothetical protein
MPRFLVSSHITVTLEQLHLVEADDAEAAVAFFDDENVEKKFIAERTIQVLGDREVIDAKPESDTTEVAVIQRRVSRELANLEAADEGPSAAPDEQAGAYKAINDHGGTIKKSWGGEGRNFID